jgi:hypothetical protein
MVESASCAATGPGTATSCIEEEAGGAPAALAGVPGAEEVVPVDPALVLSAGVRAAGATAVPPCSKDQATTAQAPDCNQKAAETLCGSPESRSRARWRISGIDYTWFGLGLLEPYRSQDPRVNIC